jgi:hypothetical protein
VLITSTKQRHHFKAVLALGETFDAAASLALLYIIAIQNFANGNNLKLNCNIFVLQLEFRKKIVLL